MNKNVLITLGVVAAVGTAGFFAWKYYKAKQAAPAPTTPAPGTSANGSNANQTNWLNTVGSLFGDLGHIFTGNSTTPTTNTTTAAPVTSDNSGTSWDSLIGSGSGFDASSLGIA